MGCPLVIRYDKDGKGGEKDSPGNALSVSGDKKKRRALLCPAPIPFFRNMN